MMRINKRRDANLPTSPLLVQLPITLTPRRPLAHHHQPYSARRQLMIPARLARLIHQANRLRLWLTRPLTLGVRLVLLRGDQVLLVRHTYQDGWLLPGGGVDRGETLEEAARREAREELCAGLGELKLLGAYTNFREWKSDHVIVFLCEAFDLPDLPMRNDEIASAEFFPLSALPADLMPGHRRRLEELQQPGHTAGVGMW